MRIQNTDLDVGTVYKVSRKKSSGSSSMPVQYQQSADSVDLGTKPMGKNKNKFMTALGISFTGGLSNVVAERMGRNGLTIGKMADFGLESIRTQYETLMRLFPEDSLYYRQMATDIGLKVGEEFRLFSVVGKSQLTDMLKKAQPQDFSVGSGFSGIDKLTHRFNLHNHTQASDGALSIDEFLEHARIYADRIAEKNPDGYYTIAITDHDITDGAGKAVILIAQDPYKYRNLRLVAGSEISVSHVNPDDVNKPLNFEMIAYGLNPFNKKFNGFLQNLRDNRNATAQVMIGEINKLYPELNLSWEEAGKFNPNLAKGTSNGSLWLVRDYAVSKLGPSADRNKISKIEQLRDSHLRAGSNMINPEITVTPAQVFDAFRESHNSGMFGVAHPGFLQADMYSDKIAEYCKSHSGNNPGYHLVWNLFKSLKETGRELFQCSEVNYQSYPVSLAGSPWVAFMKQIAGHEKMQLLDAGGIDGHSSFIEKHGNLPKDTARQILEGKVGTA